MRRAVVAGAGARKALVDELARGRAERAVVPRLRRQHDDPLLEPVEVDLRGLHVFLFAVVTLLGLVLLARLLLAGLRVVARGERRGRRLLQRHGDEPRRVRVDEGVVEVAVDRLEGLVRAEVEVVAVRAEGGVGGVVIAGGDLVPLALGRVVEEEGAHLVLQPPVVGEPPAVRRPAHGEALQRAVEHAEPLVHLRRPLPVEVVDPDPHGLIDEGDLLAVGRPVGLVAEARAEARQRLRLAALGGHEGQLVLARGVGEEGDVLAVGAPRGVALGGAGGARELADRAVLGGDGEDLAACLEDGPLAARRDLPVLDQVADVDGVRLPRRPVRHDVEDDLPRRLRGEVEEVEPSARLEHDVRRPDRRERHVEVGEVGDLPRRAGLGVDGPEVRALVRRRGRRGSRASSRATSGACRWRRCR